MPVAQSFNKILLTTSNNAENNILLQEISGSLCVNNSQVIVSDHAAPSLQIESSDSLSQITYSEDSIILEGISGHLYSNGTNLQSPTFTGLSDTPNSFVSGKYLRVNDAGDALEYVDITGVSSGGDSISSDNLYQTYLDKSSNITVFRRANQSMPPQSTVNVFEYRDSNPIYIYGGNFQSSYAKNPKITIDDVLITNSEGPILGQDQDDSDISVITIPPIYATGHVKIEWHNSSTATQHYGGLLHYATGHDIQTIAGVGGSGGSGSGSTTFTGLSDTPSDFTAGKYLRVNDAGDALEYVDITGVSGGGATSYIDSVVTKTEAGPIDKRSTDTTASSTNYYRVPVESLRFDDLEVGATYRINVSLLGYHGSNDIGANLTIRNRASSFSSDINLDSAGINNYNNNGGDPDPAVIVIASVGNDTTVYGETHSQTKIFEATGTHLDVLADSISSNSFFRNIIIQLEKITVGTSGAYASNSIISDNLSFSYNFPDALLVPLSRGNGYQERIFPLVGFVNHSATSVSGVWSGEIHYELNLGSERFALVFDHDSSGTFNTYSELNEASTTDVVWSEMSPATTNQPTLKEFIDANRAIYYK